MVEPRSRVERAAVHDRAAKEKEMLRHRKGGFFQAHYNEGMIDPFEQVEGSAAKQDERTRAASSSYREEINREEQTAHKRLQQKKLENYRDRIIERENEHWELVERQQHLIEHNAAEKRHNARPESYVNYDIISGDKHPNHEKIKEWALGQTRQEHEIEGMQKSTGLKRVFGNQIFEDNPISNRRCFYGMDKETGNNHVCYYNNACTPMDRHIHHDEHYHDGDYVENRRHADYAGFQVHPRIDTSLQEYAVASKRHSNLGLPKRIKDKEYLSPKVGEPPERIYQHNEPDWIDFDQDGEDSENDYENVERKPFMESPDNPLARWDGKDYGFGGSKPLDQSRHILGNQKADFGEGHGMNKDQPQRYRDFGDRAIQRDPTNAQSRKREFKPETWWEMDGTAPAGKQHKHVPYALQHRSSFDAGQVTLEERLADRHWVHTAADISGDRRCW